MFGESSDEHDDHVDDKKPDFAKDASSKDTMGSKPKKEIQKEHKVHKIGNRSKAIQK